jgi:hypothetical protein
MAYMYPQQSKFEYHGEETMYNALWNYLPDGYVCYYNRKVGTLEFDFTVIAPDYGIVIIEVKGYQAGDIGEVRDNSIILKGGKRIHSPFKQANKYRFMLSSIIKNKTSKDIPVYGIAAYPFISEADYKAKELHLLSNRQNTILANDLNAALPERIEQFVKQRRKEAQKQFAELTLNITEKVCSLFEP